MSTTQLRTTLVCLALLTAFAPATAGATHVFYANVSWTRPTPVDDPNVVEYTFQLGVRAGKTWQLTPFLFGDGSNVTMPSSSSTFDPSSLVGEGYTTGGTDYQVHQWVFTHRYSDLDEYRAGRDGCCRNSTLLNGQADEPFNFFTTPSFAPGDSAGPTISTLPVIALQQGGVREIAFPLFDPDGDETRCRFTGAAYGGTRNESGMDDSISVPWIPDPADETTGAKPTISNDNGVCTVSWDLTDAVEGQEFALPLVFESDHYYIDEAGDEAMVTSTAPVDVTINVVEPAPPSCAGSGQFAVEEGFSHTVTGTDTSGREMEIGVINLPDGASLSPVAGTTATGSRDVTLSWDPTEDQTGKVFTTLVTFTTEVPVGDGTINMPITGWCTLSLFVKPECGNGVVEIGESCDDGNDEDGDICPSSCKEAFCGDGYVWTSQPREDGSGAAETCDDGNRENNDGCINACVPNRCGDGFLWHLDAGGPEECDDGNNDNSDDCPNSCLLGTAPTAIALVGGDGASIASVPENLGAKSILGLLSATDADEGDVHTFTLVADGDGAEHDNASFTVLYDAVLIANAGFDHEIKNSYTLSLRVTDSAQKTYDQLLVLAVSNVNEPPTGVGLAPTAVDENSAEGTSVGTLSALGDPDQSDTHTFELVSSDTPFRIDGSALLVDAVLDYEVIDSYEIVIRATDAGGEGASQALTVTINNLNEAPTNISLDTDGVDETATTGTVVGRLSTVDPDDTDGTGDYDYELLSYTDTFEIADGNQVVVAASSLARTSYELIFKSSDAGGSSHQQAITLLVDRVNVEPTDIGLSASSVDENSALLTRVGRLSTVDADDPGGIDTYTYEILTASVPFEIVDDELRVADALNHEGTDSYTLDIRSTDPRGGSVEKRFTIAINDVNEAPTALELSAGTIAENSAADSAVGTLSTADPDDPDGTGSYLFELLTDDAPFKITGAELQVSASGALDHETAASYELRIRVADGGGLSMERAFTITVSDLNEAPTSIAISGSEVAENCSAATPVGRMSTSDPDDIAGDGAYSYELATTDAPFEIVDGNLLQVSTDDAIDYEAQDSYELAVSSTDAGGESYLQTLTVTVSDLEETPTAISISNDEVAENSASQTAVGRLSTSDPDDPVGRDVYVYELLTESSPFQIVDRNLLQVARSDALDFESEASFELRIKTIDPSFRTYEQDITITVLDLNEAPTAIALSGVTVSEDAEALSVLGDLSTTDPDDADGEDSYIYELLTGGSPFEIADGALRVAADGELDHEASASHELRIRTTDDGGLSHEQSFTITVEDSVEAPTDIRLSNSRVDEGSADGTEVGRLSTVDPDDPSGTGEYTYDLLTSDVPFLVAEGGVLQVSGTDALDFETQSSYELVFKTTDAAGESLQQTLTVEVNDVNEAPTRVSISNREIRENSLEQTPVGRLSTVDPDDLGAEDAYFYELLTTGVPFELLDGNLLQVSDSAGLDYESEDRYELRVRTSDAGGLTYEQTVEIVVLNVNEAPTGVALSGTEVLENSESGTEIGALTTTDPDDVAGSGEYLYELLGAEGQFVIEGGVLQVSSGASLDREARSSYEIRIKAIDAGGLSYERAFTIVVTDRNEAPVAVELSNGTVDENVVAGTPVGRLSCVDPDDPEGGGSCTFELVAGTAPFELVDENLIQVSVSSVLDHEQTGSYQLGVRATDSGGETVEQDVTITVANVNEAPAGLVLSNQTVDESSPVRTGVGRLSTADPDDTSGRGLYTYELLTEGVPFEIADNNLVQVSEANVLDHESRVSYEIRIRTVDEGELSYEETLTITVTNANEPPTALALSATEVTENAEIGTLVGTLSTTDSDDPDGVGEYSYEVLNASSPFRVGEGGRLEVGGPIDYEANDRIDVVIKASDAGGLSFQKVFSIAVLDVVEGRPPTAVMLSAAAIDENSLEGATVGRLSTVDPDDENGTGVYAYELMTGGSPFALEGNELRVAEGAELNHEAQPSYRIDVRSTDELEMSRTESFSISIINLNEAPLAVALSANQVAENSPLATVVGQLATQDPDQGDSHTYAVVTPGAPFGIDGSALVVTGPIDWEESQDIEITVRATDSGLLTYDAELTIDVSNVTEPPTGLTVSQARVNENADLGVVIAALVPEGGDAGVDWVVELGDEDQPFRLDGANLVVDGHLNHEAVPSYTVPVRISGGETHTETSLQLAVVDMDDLPVGSADSFATIEDTSLSAPSSVLANDLDEDGDQMSAELVSDVEHGTLSLMASGYFSYTPEADYHGGDGFEYRVVTSRDGERVTSEPISVDLEVGPVNDPPVVVDDSFRALEDTPRVVEAPGVLANDIDVDLGEDTLEIELLSLPQSGQIDLRQDGGFTYSPDLDFTGEDSFSYRISDGEHWSAPGLIVVMTDGRNDPPVAADDAFVTDEDVAVRVLPETLFRNDEDIDGDVLFAELLPTAEDGTHLGPFHGRVAVEESGGFLYVPDPDWHGEDMFQYAANDGLEASNAAVIRVTVSPVADAPVGLDDNFHIEAGGVLEIPGPGVLENDTDADGESLAAAVVQSTAKGRLHLDPDGSFVYTPDRLFSGHDTFTYLASDGSLQSELTTVSILVSANNSPPIAADDAFTIPESGELVVGAPGVLGNDRDDDGDRLFAVLEVAAEGFDQLTLAADGSLSFVAPPGFTGDVEFSYRASDGLDHSEPQTVTISVLAVPIDVPLAIDDVYQVDEDESLRVAADGDLPGLLANDIDSTGDMRVELVSDTQYGALELNDGGTFEYTPEPDFFGQDSFVYVAINADGRSNEGTVLVNVIAVGDAPVAVADSFQVDEATTLFVSAPGVLENDTDADGDDLVAVLDDAPSHGQLVLHQDGELAYEPVIGFIGDDTFTYHVHDGSERSASVEVTIVVAAVAEAPVAMNDHVEASEDTELVVDAPGLLVNDRDPDGESLLAVVEQEPTHGTLSLAQDGSFSYLPATDFNGTDYFTYRASDGHLVSDVATVVVEVAPVNDAPVIARPLDGSRFVAGEGQRLYILVTAIDVDGDAVAYSADGLPAGATLNESTGELTWTPRYHHFGEWSISLTATSEGGLTASVDIEIEVSFIDADADGVPDTFEEVSGLDPTLVDSDGDTISDQEELHDWRDPRDTDNDGVIDALDHDADGDGIPDAVEAGDSDLGTDAIDTDGDGTADYLDDDSDDDEVVDGEDNCPTEVNLDQGDIDEDETGDACDRDMDGDGIDNADEDALGLDPMLVDTDGDGLSDFIEVTNAIGDSLDSDDDGVIDALDEDSDDDGISDAEEAVDGFVLDSDGDGTPNYLDLDSDGDGVADNSDNCVLVVNLEQADRDVDGFGDICDGDVDGDEVEDLTDNCPFVANSRQGDGDEDGFGDACDLPAIPTVGSITAPTGADHIVLTGQGDQDLSACVDGDPECDFMADQISLGGGGGCSMAALQVGGSGWTAVVLLGLVLAATRRRRRP